MAKALGNGGTGEQGGHLCLLGAHLSLDDVGGVKSNSSVKAKLIVHLQACFSLSNLY